MFGTPPGTSYTHRVYKPIITKDADEEKDPFLKTKSSQSSFIKGRAWLHLKDRWALYNRRTELKTLDATISAKFSTTANFTLFNAVRLGPDDFQRVGKEIKMHSLFSERLCY